MCVCASVFVRMEVVGLLGTLAACLYIQLVLWMCKEGGGITLCYA